MQVGLLDVNGDGARVVVAEIKAAGGRADFEACDITKYDLVQAAISALEARMGPPWTLVNNAGWDTPMPFLKTTPEFWKKVVDINYLGPIHLTHAVVPGMTKRRGGRVIFISSDAGRVAFLASEDAAFMTGQTISVSGGLTMHG